MVEDSLGLFLRQHGSFFDDHVSITRSSVLVSSVLQFSVDYTVKYQSEINKSHPRLVATPKQGSN